MRRRRYRQCQRRVSGRRDTVPVGSERQTDSLHGLGAVFVPVNADGKERGGSCYTAARESAPSGFGNMSRVTRSPSR